jgi:hypothetical protein
MNKIPSGNFLFTIYFEGKNYQKKILISNFMFYDIKFKGGKNEKSSMHTHFLLSDDSFSIWGGKTKGKGSGY